MGNIPTSLTPVFRTEEIARGQGVFFSLPHCLCFFMHPKAVGCTLFSNNQDIFHLGPFFQTLPPTTPDCLISLSPPPPPARWPTPGLPPVNKVFFLFCPFFSHGWTDALSPLGCFRGAPGLHAHTPQGCLPFFFSSAHTTPCVFRPWISVVGPPFSHGFLRWVGPPFSFPLGGRWELSPPFLGLFPPQTTL